MCVVYNEFAEFKAIPPHEPKELIMRAPLSRHDRQIAIMRLVEFRHYIDIAAEVNSNRTTVSYRMRKIIAPVLYKHIS